MLWVLCTYKQRNRHLVCHHASLSTLLIHCPDWRFAQPALAARSAAPAPCIWLTQLYENMPSNLLRFHTRSSTAAEAGIDAAPMHADMSTKDYNHVCAGCHCSHAMV